MNLQPDLAGLEAMQVGSGATVRVGTSRTSQRQQTIEGYLYMFPWLAGFFIFTVGPMLASMIFSFTSYNILGNPVWIGLKNYNDILFHDELFWPSLGKAFYYAILDVPIGVTGSLLLAMLLNVKLRGTPFFRTLFYMPSLVPGVGALLLWMWMLDPMYGPVNAVLKVFGVSPYAVPQWFGSMEWAIPALVVTSLWTGIGGGRMIIFLAGLQGVPDEYYDAAAIDGAGTWGQFRHITVPMMTPVIFLNLVLGIMGALHVFQNAFIASNGTGGPAYATWFIALHIFMNAFKYFQMGYASALAWVFCVIILVLTVIQFRMARLWVYYGGER